MEDSSGSANMFFQLVSFLLCIVALWMYIHQIFFFLISIYTARRYMHRKVEPPIETPGVSIVKPLMGVDNCLQENLLSHFKLDYPKFELLFCVQDENDAAIDLVKSLSAQFPHVDNRLFIGGDSSVVNPMVSNMAPAYNAAKYELVWISTSRIRASIQILWDFVEKSLDPNVAVVHQCPFFADQPGFAAIVEKVCFGCSISRNEIALNQLGVVCFVGMSYMVKKFVLDEIGGLAFYGKYLAEDFFIAKTIRARGYQLVLSRFPADQNVDCASLRSYVTRMTRWMRLRLRMIPLVAGVLEPLTECIALGLMLAFTLNKLFACSMLHVVAVHFPIWICLDYCLLRSVQNTKLPFSFPVFLLAWICREVLVYVVYVMALVNPSVIHWGRYSYYVRMGGLTSRLPSGAANTAGAGARHRRHQSSPLLMPNHMEDHHPLVSNGPVTHNARRCHDNSAYYSPTASDLNKHPQTHTNAFLPSSTVTGGSNHT